MRKLCEQLSLNIPDYSALIFAGSGIFSVTPIYLICFGKGDLWQKPLIPIAHVLCHVKPKSQKHVLFCFVF